MSLEESNKMSQQTPSQDLPSDWAEQAYLEAAEHGWDDLMDQAEQPGNPFAEILWANEKRKALQQSSVSLDTNQN